jgi:hypothetical protein
LRARLLNLPGRLAPHCIGLATVADAERTLGAAINDAIDGMTATGEEFETDEPSDDPLEGQDGAGADAPAGV